PSAPPTRRSPSPTTAGPDAEQRPPLRGRRRRPVPPLGAEPTGSTLLAGSGGHFRRQRISGNRGPGPAVPPPWLSLLRCRSQRDRPGLGRGGRQSRLAGEVKKGARCLAPVPRPGDDRLEHRSGVPGTGASPSQVLRSPRLPQDDLVEVG